MRRQVLVTLLVLAGAALVAGLYFAFRPSSEPSSAPLTGPSEVRPEITDRTLSVTVRGGEPVGGVQHLTVAMGEQVSLRVVSDVIDDVHVHGYEISGDVRPGGTTEIEFAATMAGQFVIELEERGILIAELEVRP